MRKESGTIVYSPSDLIRYLVSLFAFWLDRYYLDNPGAITPDQETEEEIVFPRRFESGHRQTTSSFIRLLRCNLVEAGDSTPARLGPFVLRHFPRLSSALSARVSFDMQSRGVPTPRREGAKKRCVKLPDFDSALAPWRETYRLLCVNTYLSKSDF